MPARVREDIQSVAAPSDTQIELARISSMLNENAPEQRVLAMAGSARDHFLLTQDCVINVDPQDRRSHVFFRDELCRDGDVHIVARDSELSDLVVWDADSFVSVTGPRDQLVPMYEKLLRAFRPEVQDLRIGLGDDELEVFTSGLLVEQSERSWLRVRERYGIALLRGGLVLTDLLGAPRLWVRITESAQVSARLVSKGGQVRLPRRLGRSGGLVRIQDRYSDEKLDLDTNIALDRTVIVIAPNDRQFFTLVVDGDLRDSLAARVAELTNDLPTRLPNFPDSSKDSIRTGPTPEVYPANRHDRVGAMPQTPVWSRPKSVKGMLIALGARVGCALMLLVAAAILFGIVWLVIHLLSGSNTPDGNTPGSNTPGVHQNDLTITNPHWGPCKAQLGFGGRFDSDLTDQQYVTVMACAIAADIDAGG